jgi:carboxynorspermidine decarboxylase
MFGVFPILRDHLDGVCASSPHEAELGREEMGGEVHAFAAAYSESDMNTLVRFADHIVFNSFAQWRRFGPAVRGGVRRIECGLRMNPEYSEVGVAIYNPCAVGSRLGIRRADFEGQDLTGIDGLHFHTMCEQNSDTLERTLAVVEEKFAVFFDRLRWINFGGGHHITRPDYDVDRLCRVIEGFRQRYPHLTVYLEPGEAIALHTGVLVATVLDVVHNGMDIAILDTSAAAHMPDVLEMPYRPAIVGSGMPGEKPFTYRLGGLTCLAGDVIGDYSFDRRLDVGDRLVFLDMAHYTMVKNNTFNGIRLPSIATWDPELRRFTLLKTFDFTDYRNRLS